MATDTLSALGSDADLPTGPPQQRGSGARRRRWSIAAAVAAHLFTLLAVATIVFFLPRAMPGDPIDAVFDPASSQYATDPAVREHLAARYGLDRPIGSQYLTYLTDLAQGDLGLSIEQRAPVSSLIRHHLPWTMLLLGTAVTASAVLSFLGGVTAAWHRGKLRDRLMLVIMASTRAIPPYAMAALLVIAFAVVLPIFPLSGGSTPFADYDSPWARITDVGRHLALPAAALTLFLAGAKFLLVRNTMISVLGQDYMVLARAKGLPTRLLKYRHAGRNAVLPFLTFVAVEISFAMGPVIFIEAVFAYPGMGSLLLRAVAARDYPVLEGVFLVLAAVVLAANLVTELIYRRLDPRTATR